MSNWPASKARRALAALERIGWRVKRQRGSHLLLTRAGWPDYEFAFHDQQEIGPRMLARIGKRTGFGPEDWGEISSLPALFPRGTPIDGRSPCCWLWAAHLPEHLRCERTSRPRMERLRKEKVAPKPRSGACCK